MYIRVRSVVWPQLGSLAEKNTSKSVPRVPARAARELCSHLMFIFFGSIFPLPHVTYYCNNLLTNNRRGVLKPPLKQPLEQRENHTGTPYMHTYYYNSIQTSALFETYTFRILLFLLNSLPNLVRLSFILLYTFLICIAV